MNSQLQSENIKLYILGNCQTFLYRHILLRSFGDRITICEPILAYESSSLELADLLNDLESNRAALITTILNSERYRSLGVRTVDLLSRYPKQVIPVPNLHFEAFHPTWGYLYLDNTGLLQPNQCQKILSEALPMDNHQENTYSHRISYHDMLILICAQRGLGAGDVASLISNELVADRYFNKFFAESVEQIAAREVGQEIKLSEFILNRKEQARDNPFMHTINHPVAIFFAKFFVTLLENAATAGVIPKPELTDAPPAEILGSTTLPFYPLIGGTEKTCRLKIEGIEHQMPEYIDGLLRLYKLIAPQVSIQTRQSRPYKRAEYLLDSLL